MKYKIYVKGNYLFIYYVKGNITRTHRASDIRVTPTNSDNTAFNIKALPVEDALDLNVNINVIGNEDGITYTPATWEEFYTLETGGKSKASNGNITTATKISLIIDVDKPNITVTELQDVSEENVTFYRDGFLQHNTDYTIAGNVITPVSEFIQEEKITIKIHP